MNQSRLTRELENINEDVDTSGVSAERVAGKPLILVGKVIGPEATPYERGIFIVDIEIPSDYPFVPPKMKFRTKIWHPNISSVTGAICLDILKVGQWR